MLGTTRQRCTRPLLILSATLLVSGGLLASPGPVEVRAVAQTGSGSTKPQTQIPPTSMWSAPAGNDAAIASISSWAKSAGVAINPPMFDDRINALVVPVVGSTTPERIRALKASAGSLGGLVRVISVNRSYSATQALERQVISSDRSLEASGVHFTSVGISMYGDALLVGVSPKDNIATARQVLSSRFGTGISVFAQGLGTAATRTADYSPWTGGDYYYNSFSNYSLRCTSGFAVTKPGYGNYMLTAGHCFQSSSGSAVTGIDSRYYYNGNPIMGYDSQADLVSGQLGTDNALVTGDYYPYVWYSSSNRFTVKSANTSSTEPTADVCLDGAVSGQVCRNYIQQTQVYLKTQYTFGPALLIGPMVETLQQTYSASCQGGDSGGPVYDAVSGGVRARGIIIAQLTNVNYQCYYMPWFAISDNIGGPGITVNTG